jgi:hypothetical protein
VERQGDRAQIRLPFTASVDFQIADVEKVEETSRTAISAGIGAHGWRGHWTINSGRAPAVRITFRAPVRLHVLGLRFKVKVLDVAPARRESVVEQLRLSG